MHRVRPIFWTPRDSWMCPCSPTPGLVLLDRFAHRVAAHRDDARPAAADHRLQRGVEFGRVVQRRPVRRAVEVHDQLGLGGTGSSISLDAACQFFLGALALGVPRRGRHDADARHRQRPELAELELGALDPIRAVEDRVRVPRVVVARRDDDAHRGVEPLGGQVAPALRLGRDLGAEQPLQRLGSPAEPGYSSSSIRTGYKPRLVMSAASWSYSATRHGRPRRRQRGPSDRPGAAPGRSPCPRSRRRAAARPARTPWRRPGTCGSRPRSRGGRWRRRSAARASSPS